MAAEMFERDSHVGVEMAWHKLTKVVPSITRDNCGIVYPMEIRPLFVEVDGSMIATPHYVVVSRDDNLPIGNPVSDRYANISNSAIFEAVEKALNFTDHQIVSVGTCNNRERGYISVKLDDDFVAAERKTASTLNVLWGHGGVMNVIARTGFTVVVCRNTFNLALKERRDFSFKIRHTGDATLSLDNMKQAIEGHVTAVDTFRTAMDEFAKQSINSRDAKQLFAGFVVDDLDEDKPVVSTRAKNMYSELHRLFHDGRGNSGRTAADVFSATTDYFTHGTSDSKKSMQSRFESSEFGSGNERKQEMFVVLKGGKTSRVGTVEDCLKRGTKVLEVAA